MTVLLTAFLVSVVAASTPLLLAAVGELVAEKAGVLNLGVEGMMLGGAIAAFATAHATKQPLLGVLAALLCGVALSMVFAVVALTLQANQTATGLALTIFGRGLSALLGAGFVGIPAPVLPKLNIAGLSTIPILGPVVFAQDPLVYLALVLLVVVAWCLRRTRLGLVLRAVGDSHDAAHSLGYPVLLIRYAAVAFGGALAGLAGAYMSLAYTPMWAHQGLDRPGHGPEPLQHRLPRHRQGGRAGEPAGERGRVRRLGQLAVQGGAGQPHVGRRQARARLPGLVDPCAHARRQPL